MKASYLSTGGAEIRTSSAPGAICLHVQAGSRVAILGDDLFKKHCFCDWVLGFHEPNGSNVRMEYNGSSIEDPAERLRLASLLGRSPLLVGETIQESMLYRTKNIGKAELFDAIKRFYGPGLRDRTDPRNPLLGRDGKPISTQHLTVREHLEVAQINVMLQKSPLVIIDLSSRLMEEALAQGFRPCLEFETSGKTLFFILPPERDIGWANTVTGLTISASLAV